MHPAEYTAQGIMDANLGKIRFMKFKAKKLRIAYVSVTLALLIYAFLIEPNWVQVSHH